MAISKTIVRNGVVCRKAGFGEGCNQAAGRFSGLRSIGGAAETWGWKAAKKEPR